MSSTEMQEIGKNKGSSASSSDEEPEETDDVRVQFIQHDHDDVTEKKKKDIVQFSGLSKEEVMKFQNDPFWKRVRLILFILFWVLWAAMIVAAVLIIYFSPKCPPIPKRSFWQKSPGYLVDVATFKDSNGDGVGDLKGVIDKVDYLESKGGFVIFGSILEGSLGTKDVRAPAITDFKKVDERVGTFEDVKKVLKECNKRQLKAVIEFPPHTGKDHAWFKKAAKGDKEFQKYYIWNSKSDSKMVNRIGKPVWNKVGSEFYFSSLHESVPALDLNNTDVQTALQGAVRFWLKAGFSGIFIDNVAFLAPDITTTDIGSGLDVASVKTGDLKKWYAGGHKGQLLTLGATDFVTKARAWVDEVRHQANRELLLLVSPGNTGLKHERNSTLRLLGDSKAPGAHSVIVFDLVPSRGAKVVKPKEAASLREAIDHTLSVLPDRVMLMTQTMAGPRRDDATMTFLNILLPTASLTLYGEEIGMLGYGDKLPKDKKDPGPPYSFITQAAFADKSAYIDDLLDTYNVPMQWTPTGGFSKNITYDNKANVMTLSTLGREMTRYKAFLALVKLNKEPSLNWGQLQWIESQEKKEPHHFIFSRAAAGFPKFLVVITRPTKKSGGLVRNVSSVCKSATNYFSDPPNSDFEVDKKLPMRNVFFRFSPAGSIYIFKCIA